MPRRSKPGPDEVQANLAQNGETSLQESCSIKTHSLPCRKCLCPTQGAEGIFRRLTQGVPRGPPSSLPRYQEGQPPELLARIIQRLVETVSVEAH